MTEQYQNFIQENLPYGAGINATWTIRETKNFIHFQNSYQCMNEIGYCDGWQDFSVVISKEDFQSGDFEMIGLTFKLQFNNGQYKAQKYHLRDYLEDTIYYTITES